MVTIISAGYRHGYSGWDHMITGRECEDVIGKSYRSVGEARIAACKSADKVADRRVAGAPIYMSVMFRGGTVVDL